MVGTGLLIICYKSIFHSFMILNKICQILSICWTKVHLPKVDPSTLILPLWAVVIAPLMYQSPSVNISGLPFQDRNALLHMQMSAPFPPAKSSKRLSTFPESKTRKPRVFLEVYIWKSAGMSQYTASILSWVVFSTGSCEPYVTLCRKCFLGTSYYSWWCHGHRCGTFILMDLIIKFWLLQFSISKIKEGLSLVWKQRSLAFKKESAVSIAPKAYFSHLGRNASCGTLRP